MRRPNRLVAVAVAVTVGAVACEGGAYVYFARRYDDSRDCLDKVEALDVINGTDPGVGCSPRCITVRDVDGGLYLYGTTACGPAPFGANSSESDPRCAAVRAAVATTNVCKPDSGVKDSGSDTGVDAALDAGADVGLVDAATDAPVDSAAVDGGSD